MGKTEPAEVDEDGTTGLRFTVCIIADIEDLSTSCAAQMEEIDSSKAAGSSTSAGTRSFKVPL